jgi:hypothetical protein
MMESMPTIGQLSEGFTEDMKTALREEYSSEGKSIDELHSMLYSFRSRFGLAPWNPVTLYFKQLAAEVRVGQRFSQKNAWASHYGSFSDYQPEIPADKKDNWVRLSVTIRRGDVVSEPVVFAVHPACKICWSYAMESKLNTRANIHMPNGPMMHLELKRLFKKALGYVRVGHKCGELFNIEFSVNLKIAETRRANRERLYAQSMNKVAAEIKGDTKSEQVATKKLTPAIEAAENSHIISDADRLLLRMALDVAEAPFKQINASGAFKALTALINRLTGSDNEEATNES